VSTPKSANAHRNVMRAKVELAVSRARKKAERLGRPLTNADVESALKGVGIDSSAAVAMFRYAEVRSPV
jgi:hypothetical protein